MLLLLLLLLLISRDKEIIVKLDFVTDLRSRTKSQGIERETYVALNSSVDSEKDLNSTFTYIHLDLFRSHPYI